MFSKPTIFLIFTLLLSSTLSLDWDTVKTSFSNSQNDIEWTNNDMEPLRKETYECDNLEYGLILDSGIANFDLEFENAKMVKVEFDYQLKQKADRSYENGNIDIKIMDVHHSIPIHDEHLEECAAGDSEVIMGSHFSVIIKDYSWNFMDISIDITETDLINMGIRNFKISLGQEIVTEELRKVLYKRKYTCEDLEILRNTLDQMQDMFPSEPGKALQDRNSIINILESLQNQEEPEFMMNLEEIQNKYRDESEIYSTISDETLYQIDMIFMNLDNSADIDAFIDEQQPDSSMEIDLLMDELIEESQMYDRMVYIEGHFNRLKESC